MFVPQGAIGCLGTLFVLILFAVLLGFVTGVCLAIAVFALLGLALLIRLAFRQELRRDDPSNGTAPYAPLPSDADLSDEQRRDAQQRQERR